MTRSEKDKALRAPRLIVRLLECGEVICVISIALHWGLVVLIAVLAFSLLSGCRYGVSKELKRYERDLDA